MKCKGFTMDSENSKKITIEAYKKLVQEYVAGKKEVLETADNHFGYDKSQPTRFVYTENRTKKLKLTAEKSAIEKKV